MSGPRPDPHVPLRDAPDPWAPSGVPEPRAGPPYHMTEMIAAEPALARRLLERLATPDGAAARLAEAVARAVAAGEPVVATGCGTSEHAAMATAEVLRDALPAAGPGAGRQLVTSVQAFELMHDPPSSGLVLGVSHEGGTWATNRALQAAGAAGARVSLVTVSERSPGAALADRGLLVTTGEMDESWCHTVGYLSPVLVAVAAGAHLAGRSADPNACAGLVGAGLATAAAAERVAAALAGSTRIVVVATGADRPAGRELVLKIEEGAWLPAAYRDLETLLHGHLAGTDASGGLVALLVDRRASDARVARLRQALAAAAEIGLPAAAILAEGAAARVEETLTPAGRVVVPDAPTLPAPVAALLGSATPLQLLAERLARARGIDPDAIRRGDPRYRAAAARVEG